jgi:hypothetical protein
MDIRNSIPVLIEEEDLSPVTTLEDVQKLHKSLTLDNPMTFKVFLSKRPDLEENKKDIYLKIIERLEHNERIKYKKAMAIMVTADYPPSFTTDVYDA